MVEENPDFSKIRAVGFDLDNTLYTITPKMRKAVNDYVIREASKILNKSVSKVKSEFKRINKSKNSVRGTLLEMKVENGSELTQKAIEQANIAQYLETDKRLIKMLFNLNRKFNLYLITSSKEENALPKLDALGININIFTYYQLGRLEGICREDGTAFKTTLEYFNTYTEKKIKLDNMMFVGDRLNVDIIPAKNLDMKAAYVTWGKKYKKEKEEDPTPDLVIKKIYDLEDYLIKKE